MISIIICSKKPTLSVAFQENLVQTIGCEYELIVIDNSESRYSIFEAYNLGIQKSQGTVLCFVHDDVLFHSSQWGLVLDTIFRQQPFVGLIGVAGSKVKTKSPSAWWDCEEGDRITSIIQHYQDKEAEMHHYGFDENPTVEVAVIDGVFMAVRNDKRLSFSKQLQGFHCYDLNLSLEIKKLGFSVVVTQAIVIEHFSSGVLNISWVQNSYQLHRSYSKLLPIAIGNSEVTADLELLNAHRFINKCLQHRCKFIALRLWFTLFLKAPFSIKNLKLFKKIVTFDY